MKSDITIALLCAITCGTAQVMAQENADEDSLLNQFTIQEVQVTANIHNEPVVPVQRLEGEKLTTLSTHSVADAIRYFSGVQIKDYGGVGGMKTVDMRSMGSNHLGVFYDGIEIGNAQNGIVDLGKFSAENLEEVALYNGQKSEIFQSAKDFGSAGTLYLKTRRPKFENGRNFHIVGTMKAGTFGLANPSFLYEQKLTDNIHLSANAEYTYANGRYHFNIHRVYPDGSVAWDTTGVRQNGDIQAFRAEAGIFGYLPDGKWHVKGYYYQSERGIPRAIIRNVWTSDQRQWDRNAFVQGNFTKTLFEGYDFSVSAKYSNDKMRYLNPDTTLMYIDNTFLQQELYISVANRYSVFKWWDLSLSADYQLNWLDANMAQFVHPMRHTGYLALATDFHYKWIRGMASVLGTFVKDVTDVQTTDTKYNFSPAVFLSYQPILKEQLFFRTYYKLTYRMPTFNDLYYTDVGNINLSPENARQYCGGIEYTKRLSIISDALKYMQLHIKADGYFNQIENKIVAVPKGNSQYRWMMMNIGYVEIRGCDINAGLDFDFSHDVHLSLSGAYTFQKAQDFTNASDTITYGGQISYIPWHSCSATGNLSWRGWTLNYSFIYVGERYDNSANIPANYQQPWYTHDLSLNKMFHFNGWKFSAGVEINNMLNQQYAVILNYPMPGINGKVIVKFII